MDRNHFHIRAPLVWRIVRSTWPLLVVMTLACGTPSNAPARRTQSRHAQAIEPYEPARAQRQESWVPVRVAGGITTRIPEASLEFELPNPEWKRADRDRAPESVLYGFKRTAVRSPAGEDIFPYIGVIVQPNGPDTGNWVDVYEEILPRLPSTKIGRMLDFRQGEVGALNAGGIQGEYELDGRPHAVFVVFATHGQVQFTITMDTTTEVFATVEPEFKATLGSLRHYQ